MRLNVFTGTGKRKDHGGDGDRATGVEATAEPAHALLGGAAGESVRYDFSAGTRLQGVVVDCRGGCQRFLDIAGFQPVEALLGVMSPDA